MSPSISAVVCTYNRKRSLIVALNSLVAQDLPIDDYEIVVVDNSSTDGTMEALVERFCEVPNLRVINVPALGVARARNAGAKACRSPIAAYLDDDAIAPPDWLRRLRDAYADVDPMTVCVGGDMEPIFEVERPAWLSDYLLRPLSVRLCWPGGAHYLRDNEWLCELNSAYRIEPLLRFGGFPENLGRVGESLLSGENAVNDVLRHAGHRFYYDPDIVVQHHVPKSRMTRDWFRRRMFWQGVTFFAVRDYLNQRGVPMAVHRPLGLPCAPADWVRLFDEELEGEELVRALHAVEDIAYLLTSQKILTPTIAGHEKETQSVV